MPEEDQLNPLDEACVYPEDLCGDCGGAIDAGCIDDAACNYNSDASCDDGSVFMGNQGVQTVMLATTIVRQFATTAAVFMVRSGARTAMLPISIPTHHATITRVAIIDPCPNFIVGKEQLGTYSPANVLAFRPRTLT